MIDEIIKIGIVVVKSLIYQRFQDRAFASRLPCGDGR